MEFPRFRRLLRVLSEPVVDVSQVSVNQPGFRKLPDLPDVKDDAGSDGDDEYITFKHKSDTDTAGGDKTQIISAAKPAIIPRKAYTMKEVAYHCDYGSCWVVIHDKVYDVTKFKREHPGGEDVILEHAGRDVTVPFCDVGHSKDAIVMLEKYCIGALVDSERIVKRQRKVTV